MSSMRGLGPDRQSTETPAPPRFAPALLVTAVYTFVVLIPVFGVMQAGNNDLPSLSLPGPWLILLIAASAIFVFFVFRRFTHNAAQASSEAVEDGYRSLFDACPSPSEPKLSRRRVVVTGMGIISPVGNTVAQAWSNISNGRSGIGRISRFDAQTFPTQIAGDVKDFDLAAYWSPKEARRYDTFIHYGLAAAIDALKDAGIDKQPANAERIGVCIGSGIGGLPLIEDTHLAYREGGVRKITPFFVPGSIINMISRILSINFRVSRGRILRLSARVRPPITLSAKLSV